MKKLAVVCLSLLLLCSCTTTSSRYTLFSSYDTDNDVYYSGGMECQLAADGNLTVVMSAQDVEPEDTNNTVNVALYNASGDTYFFEDSALRVYGRTYGDWEYISRWDAERYYDDVSRYYRAEEISAVFSGIGDVADAGKNGDETDIAIAAIKADIGFSRLSGQHERDLQYLRRNLLYSFPISPGCRLMGLVFFPVDRQYTEYMVKFEKADGSDFEFKFRRSDCEEILHPWSAETSRDMLSICLGAGIALGPEKQTMPKYSFTMQLLQAEKIGFYMGAGVYGNPQTLLVTDSGYGTLDAQGLFVPSRPTPEIEYLFVSESCFAQYFDVPLGLTYKIMPHTWLLAGGDFAFASDYYHTGRLYARNSGSGSWGAPVDEKAVVTQPALEADAGISLGVSVLYNWANVYCLGSYLFANESFVIEAGAGIAF